MQGLPHPFMATTAAALPSNMDAAPPELFASAGVMPYRPLIRDGSCPSSTANRPGAGGFGMMRRELLKGKQVVVKVVRAGEHDGVRARASASMPQPQTPPGAAPSVSEALAALLPGAESLRGVTVRWLSK